MRTVKIFDGESFCIDATLLGQNKSKNDACVVSEHDDTQSQKWPERSSMESKNCCNKRHGWLRNASWLSLGVGAAALMSTTKPTRSLLAQAVSFGAKTAAVGSISVLGVGAVCCAGLYFHNLLVSEERKNKLIALYMPAIMGGLDKNMRDVRRELLKNVKGKVLDLGCGSGDASYSPVILFCSWK